LQTSDKPVLLFSKLGIDTLDVREAAGISLWRL